MSADQALLSAEPFVVASVHELTACRVTAVSLGRLDGPRLVVQLVDADLDLEDDLWRVSGVRAGPERPLTAVLASICSPRELARRFTPTVVGNALAAGRPLTVLEAGSVVLGGLEQLLQPEAGLRVAGVPSPIAGLPSNLPVWGAGRTLRPLLGSMAEVYETQLAREVDVVRDLALALMTRGKGVQWTRDDSIVQAASVVDLRSAGLDRETRTFLIGRTVLSVVGPNLPPDDDLVQEGRRPTQPDDGYAALLRVCFDIRREAQGLTGGEVEAPAPAPGRLPSMSPALVAGARQLLAEQPTLLVRWRESGDAEAVRAAFADWLGRPNARTSSVVSNAAVGVWRGRGDLQVHFPDPVLADSDRYLTWLATQGAAEEALQPSWCDSRATLPARSSAPGRPLSGSPVIVLVGHLDSALGVGQAARHLRRGLQDAGCMVRTVAVPPDGRIPLDQAEALAKTDPALCIWAVNPPESLSVMNALSGLWSRSGVNVGYWWWEVAWLPPVFRQCGEVLDEIWAGTGFVAECLAPMAPVPVHRAPLYLSPDLPVSTLSRAELGWPSDRTVFLARADFHSSPARKNPEGALRAYLQAFPSTDQRDALLVIKVENAAADAHSLDRLRLLSGGRPDVALLTRRLTEADNNAVTACADVYVSVHRSEGLGLPIAEAMALRTAVIATDFGGSAELLSGNSAALVPARLVPVVDPSGTYRGGSWAEPDLAAASKAMRMLSDDDRVRERLAVEGHARFTELGDPEALGKFVRARLASRGQLGRPITRFLRRSTRGRAR